MSTTVPTDRLLVTIPELSPQESVEDHIQTLNEDEKAPLIMQGDQKLLVYVYQNMFCFNFNVLQAFVVGCTNIYLNDEYALQVL